MSRLLGVIGFYTVLTLKEFWPFSSNNTIKKVSIRNPRNLSSNFVTRKTSKRLCSQLSTSNLKPFEYSGVPNFRNEEMKHVYFSD